MSPGRTTAALRTSSLIALGAFAVHQIRYLGSGGSDAHGYLEAVVPVLVVVVASGIAGALAAAFFSRDATARTPMGWAPCTAAVLVIFGMQETMEGALSPAHPGGVAAILGDGGWIVVPVAVVIGRLVSLLLSGLASVERKLAGARLLPRRGPRVLRRPAALRAWPLVRESLQLGLAPRPPPHPTG